MASHGFDPKILDRRVYPAGKVIFNMDDLGHAAYLIRRGSVEIYKEQDGQAITIATCGPGEIFGEMAILTMSPRSTFARAATDCELVVITGSMIERMIEDTDPGVRALVRILVTRLRDILDHIEVCPVTGRFRLRQTQ